MDILKIIVIVVAGFVLLVGVVVGIKLWCQRCIKRLKWAASMMASHLRSSGHGTMVVLNRRGNPIREVSLEDSQGRFTLGDLSTEDIFWLQKHGKVAIYNNSDGWYKRWIDYLLDAFAYDFVAIAVVEQNCAYWISPGRSGWKGLEEIGDLAQRYSYRNREEFIENIVTKLGYAYTRI